MPAGEATCGATFKQLHVGPLEGHVSCYFRMLVGCLQFFKHVLVFGTFFWSKHVKDIFTTASFDLCSTEKTDSDLGDNAVWLESDFSHGAGHFFCDGTRDGFQLVS